MFRIKKCAYNLRGNGSRFDQPNPNTSFKHRSFYYNIACRLWNNVPLHVRQAPNLKNFVAKLKKLKDVRAYCYWASLVRTLNMTWCMPRHVFQARALSRNSTKYRADDLCDNFICEYFCWMLGDPHFFFGRSLPFLILSIILKNKKKSVRGKLLLFLIYYSNRVELVHGYSCARLRSCLF